MGDGADSLDDLGPVVVPDGPGGVDNEHDVHLGVTDRNTRSAGAGVAVNDLVPLGVALAGAGTVTDGLGLDVLLSVLGATTAVGSAVRELGPFCQLALGIADTGVAVSRLLESGTGSTTEHGGSDNRSDSVVDSHSALGRAVRPGSEGRDRAWDRACEHVTCGCEFQRRAVGSVGGGVLDEHLTGPHLAASLACSAACSGVEGGNLAVPDLVGHGGHAHELGLDPDRTAHSGLVLLDGLLAVGSLVLVGIEELLVVDLNGADSLLELLDAGSEGRAVLIAELNVGVPALNVELHALLGLLADAVVLVPVVLLVRQLSIDVTSELADLLEERGAERRAGKGARSLCINVLTRDLLVADLLGEVTGVLVVGIGVGANIEGVVGGEGGGGGGLGGGGGSLNGGLQEVLEMRLESLELLVAHLHHRLGSVGILEGEEGHAVFEGASDEGHALGLVDQLLVLLRKVITRLEAVASVVRVLLHVSVPLEHRPGLGLNLLVSLRALRLQEARYALPGALVEGAGGDGSGDLGG
mmetsp:Transcript_39192/g.77093  ORF Transcript_39192/g.77093 Transcript_39192/m.77093 type:complete len:526 (+) Transcript_39192:1336-2913(+)